MIELLFYPGLAIIRWWTRSPHGHVAVRICQSGTAGIDDDVYEAVAEGVIVRRFDPTGVDRRTSAVVLLPGLTDTQVGAMRHFLDGELMAHYDWLAIAFDIAGRYLPAWLVLRDDDDRRWDCSRLAAAALRAASVALPGLDDLRCPVSPGDLYRILTQQRG